MKKIYHSLSKLIQFNRNNAREDIEKIILTENTIIDCAQELNISRMLLANRGIDIEVVSTEKGRDITIETLILESSTTFKNDSSRLLHIEQIYVNEMKMNTQPYYNVSYIACEMLQNQCYIIVTSNMGESADQTQIIISGNTPIEYTLH